MKQYSKTTPSHPPDARVSGWSNGLSQDYNRGLGAWFASRLGARYQLMADIAKAAEQTRVSNGYAFRDDAASVCSVHLPDTVSGGIQQGTP